MTRLILVLLTSALILADPPRGVWVVEYGDAEHPVVTNRVTRISERQSLFRWSHRTNEVYLLSPALPDADNWRAEWQHWKVDGTNVVEWSTEEIAAEAATNAVLQLAAQKAGEKAQVDADEVLKATVKVLLDEINLLRAELNEAKTNITAWRQAPTLPARTAAQARTAIKGEIDAR